MQHTFNSNEGETTSDFISRVDNEVARLNQEWSNQNLAEKISSELGEITVTFDGDTMTL